MAKVTNNHNGIISVAGVDIRPGATVEIADKDYNNWSGRGTAKAWLKAGIVSVEGAKVKAAPAGDKEPKEPTEREALEAQAAALGLDFSGETSDEDLLNAIMEADQAQKGDEREALFKEARALGLNPNANTGTEKLKKLIADKKGE